MEVIISNLSDLEAFAGQALERWRDHQPSGAATVVGLRGELGAGKTALAQAVGRRLGLTAAITSPTFVVLKKYEIKSDYWPWRFWYHLDAYRLAGSADLEALGWQKIIADPGAFVLVEWAERVASALPAGAHEVAFGVLPEQARRIRLSP
ncbi:MAG: tRNA (adenosine(37)-N6)-threonylcarbamoyltransferase complex ATPase subunit type 1 TsaE [Patescibacteria group bacterium]